MSSEETEVRALVLARALQGRMVRAANGLFDAATQAAQMCERRVDHDPSADDVTEWQERAKYWRQSAQRALEVLADWEETA